MLGTAMQDSAGIDRHNRRRTHLTHDRFQFAGKNIKYRFDPFLSEGGKTPALRSPKTHARRAQSQRLEHVGTPSHAAIH